MAMYYLQDSRFFLGNTVVWWAQDGGFTVDVSKAKVFTEDEAHAWHRVRESDIPWPQDYIDQHTKPTIDMLDIERRDADRAVTSLAIRLPKCQHCDDVIKEAICHDHGCDRWAQIHGVRDHGVEHNADSPSSSEKSQETTQQLPEKLSSVLKTSKPIN